MTTAAEAKAHSGTELTPGKARRASTTKPNRDNAPAEACRLSGHHIWSDRYDRELTDIFALRDEITASVTTAIEPKLLAAEEMRAEKCATENLDAWDLVARASSHLWKLSGSESKTAIEILRDAAERFTTYAPAHSMQAFALLVSGHMEWIPTAEDRALTARLANRAAQPKPMESKLMSLPGRFR
jgi:adenylate cyclase